MVVELVLLGAREPVLHVHVAHLVLVRRSVIITVVDVLTTPWSRTRLPVHFKTKTYTLLPQVVHTGVDSDGGSRGPGPPV